MMTPAEKERSQRICEALGTAACAFLTWPIACSLMESWTAHNALLGSDIPNSLVIGFSVFMSYLGVFVILDRWWRSYHAGHTNEMRLNWLFIPFAGTFFSFLNAYLAAPQIRAVQGTANWVSETLLISLGYGALMVCVMFCFWVFGFVARYTRGRF